MKKSIGTWSDSKPAYICKESGMTILFIQKWRSSDFFGVVYKKGEPLIGSQVYAKDKEVFLFSCLVKAKELNWNIKIDDKILYPIFLC